MIRCSIFFVSPACHNRVTWLASSAQQLTLLAVVRKRSLWQAPPPWRHNTLPWWRHIQNSTSFRNLELDTLSDVKTQVQVIIDWILFTSRDDLAELWSAWRLLTHLGTPAGPYHITKPHGVCLRDILQNVNAINSNLLGSKPCRCIGHNGYSTSVNMRMMGANMMLCGFLKLISKLKPYKSERLKPSWNNNVSSGCSLFQPREFGTVHSWSPVCINPDA